MILRLSQCLASSCLRGPNVLTGAGKTFVLQVNRRPVICRVVLQQNFSTNSILRQFKFGKESPLPRWVDVWDVSHCHNDPVLVVGPNRRQQERGTWRLSYIWYLQPLPRPGPPTQPSLCTKCSVRPPATGGQSRRATTRRRWRPWRSRRRDFSPSSSMRTPRLRWGEKKNFIRNIF